MAITTELLKILHELKIYLVTDEKGKALDLIEKGIQSLEKEKNNEYTVRK